MLRSLNEIKGYTLQATDGDIGGIKDVFFDDQSWTLRYFVASTHRWLPGRKVLISPASVGEPDWTAQVLPVSLTKEQIKESPPLKTEEPLSRQHEENLSVHFGWPAYWGPIGGGALGQPFSPSVPPQPLEQTEDRPPEGDPHLRSVDEVDGYHIEGEDGEVGHVQDFIVNTEDWVLRYLVVDTRNWLPGRQVLISPQWAESIDWYGESVHVELTREAVRNSPEYNPDEPVSRDYEIRLYDYYGRPKYWE